MIQVFPLLSYIPLKTCPIANYRIVGTTVSFLPGCMVLFIFYFFSPLKEGGLPPNYSKF
jgi:hypothetical protein